MKKFCIAFILMLLFLPICLAEESRIINLIDHPDAEYVFQDNTPLLEIVFPRIFSSDCTIIRYGDATMLVDSSTNSPDLHERIRTAIELMGIDHFDVAYNSHPHRDHILGFPIIYEYAPFKTFYVTFSEEVDPNMKKVCSFMREQNVSIETLNHGDQILLGDNEELVIDVIQNRSNTYWSLNDRSAMLHITFGNRSILLTGDNGSKAQRYFCETLPEEALKADIIKYPHHGISALSKEFKEAVDPQLCILNGAVNTQDAAKAYLKKQNIPYLIAYSGITRMRTDGSIWVIDYLQ